MTAVLQRADGAARQTEVVNGKESTSWENVNNYGMSNSNVECGSISLSKMAEAKKILEGVAQERQEGTQGQWEQESPFREVLEQVRGNADMGCGKAVSQ